MKNGYKPLWKRGMIVYTGPAPESPDLNAGVIVHVYKPTLDAPSWPWVRIQFGVPKAWMETSTNNVVWTGRWQKR
jgi:hypothetical protein